MRREKKDLEKCKEPSYEEIIKHMKATGLDYYNAREYLRKLAYGSSVPNGYRSWGDYWKSY